MNHKFEKNNTDTSGWGWMTNWDLIITINNYTITYVVHYHIEFNCYCIYVGPNPNQPRMLKTQKEIIKYLVSNNICTISDKTKHVQKLILTPNALLELI